MAASSMKASGVSINAARMALDPSVPSPHPGVRACADGRAPAEGPGRRAVGPRDLGLRAGAAAPGTAARDASTLCLGLYDESIKDYGALDAAFLEKPFVAPVLAGKVREVLDNPRSDPPDGRG